NDRADGPKVSRRSNDYSEAGIGPSSRNFAGAERILGRDPEKCVKFFLRQIGRLHLAFVRWYLTFMKTVISSKGQIVLPAELRKQDKIRAGQQFEIERVEVGDYRLKRVAVSEKGSVLE